MISKAAVFSPDERFRYSLTRRWASGQPLVFVMLNPSTADANIDDPTIRRCMGFARAHEFGAIKVVNLYAYRATRPKDLRDAGFPVGPENDTYISQAVRDAGAVCIAWGSSVGRVPRQDEVIDLILQEKVSLSILGLTNKGIPRHPLFVKSDAKLRTY